MEKTSGFSNADGSSGLGNNQGTAGLINIGGQYLAGQNQPASSGVISNPGDVAPLADILRVILGQNLSVGTIAPKVTNGGGTINSQTQGAANAAVGTLTPQGTPSGVSALVDILSNISSGVGASINPNMGKFSGDTAASGTLASDLYNRIQNAKITNLDQQLNLAANTAAKYANQTQTQTAQYHAGSGGHCYISTAICLNLGKADDCEELQLLRNWRDTVLRKMPEGEVLISSYYDFAPLMVEELNKTETSATYYNALYNSFLVPAMEQIREGRNVEALATYVQMLFSVKELITYLKGDE